MRQVSTGRTTQIREPITPSVGDAEAVAGRRVGPPLFGTLLASRPNAERRSTAVATAVAVAMHAAVKYQNVIGAMDAARGAGVTVLGAILPRSEPTS